MYAHINPAIGGLESVVRSQLGLGHSPSQNGIGSILVLKYGI